MRLTPDEIAAIKDCARAHFGEGAVVRLFGSRVRDDLRGGDIDLHITADADEKADWKHESSFKSSLCDRIGEQRIDVLVNGPSGPRQPIERIAVETGIVIPDLTRPVAGRSVHDVVGSRLVRRRGRTKMSQRELLSEALRSGERTKVNLTRLLAELSPNLPMTAAMIDSIEWLGRLRTDSLLLQFNNMVATVQDQLIRGILLAAEEPVARQSRVDQRNVAEKLGALPDGIDFKAIIDARNGIAHQYPADLAIQAGVINDAAKAATDLIRAFDGLAAYIRGRNLADG